MSINIKYQNFGFVKLKDELDVATLDKNIHLHNSQFNFNNWTIALAYEEKTSFNPEVICCSKNF